MITYLHSPDNSIIFQFAEMLEKQNFLCPILFAVVCMEIERVQYPLRDSSRCLTAAVIRSLRNYRKSR